MENFISGYPGCEFQIRDALQLAIGKEKSEFFFDKVRHIPLGLEFLRQSNSPRTSSFSNISLRSPMLHSSSPWA
jgi:hypothetical protein